MSEMEYGSDMSVLLLEFHMAMNVDGNAGNLETMSWTLAHGLSNASCFN